MSALFAQILLDTALKGALLVALGAVLAAVAVRSAAATRHMIWSAVIGAHLVLPLITVLGPGLDLRVLPPPPWLVTDHAALYWVWFVWLIGVIVGTLPLLTGAWRVARLRRGSYAVASDITGGDVDIRYSAHLTVPVVCGIVRPSILLPANAVSWTEARRRLVLEHELAHVRRHDTASQLLAQIALVIFWFDPLLVVAVRAMRRERELACDDVVLSSGVAPWDYAHELIEVARSAQRAPAILASLVTLGFETRIAAILDASRNRRRPSRRDVVLTLLLAMLVTIPLGVLRPFRDSLP